jgi:T5SS/PEP-CTERM-associated repeat protein/autotransporter-associated beta strand protein
MVAPVLGADLIVDTGTTTITSSDNYDNTFIGIGAPNNRLNVLNAGTVLANSVDVFVGRFSSGNSMVISNGARVVNIDGYIGTFAGLAPNNSVLVTGTGSTWANTGNLNVSFQSSGNTLTVANGGAVSANILRIATQVGSSGTVNIGSLGGSDTAGSLGTTPITFGAGTGTLNFNQTDTATLTQLISSSTGVNTVSQLGSGTTILSGANTYTGTTAITAGTLWAQSTRALGLSSVNLTGGTLRLGSYLEVDTMTWGGGQIYIPTLTSANGIYLNITNAATGLTNTTSTNQFNVTGANLTLNVPTKLLSATNMTTINFSTNDFTVTGLRKYNLSISNGALWLTSLFSSYTIYAATPNQYQVASALNGFQDSTSGDRTTVTTAINSLTTDAQYQAAFEQIMPSTYSSLPTLAFNTANALNTKLFERIWLMQVAGLSGAAVAGDSPTQNNDNNPLGLKADQNWSPFVDANGIFASANSGGTLDTYNAQNGGVTTGGMYKFLPNLMAGAYAGYQYTHAGYDGSTSMEDNAARFGLLASWAGETCYRNTDNIYLNGLVGGQMHNYNVDRQIVFSDINRTANATPTAGEFDSAVQVGYNFREGGFTFGPQASLQYTYLGVNSFDESGADSLDLNVDSFNSSSMMFTLGGQGAYRIEVDEELAVIPMASASWQHECLQNPYGIQSAFATGGASESFNFQSSAPLRDFFYGGVGVGFAIGQTWQVTVLWNASAANADLASQNIYISAAARF